MGIPVRYIYAGSLKQLPLRGLGMRLETNASSIPQRCRGVSKAAKGLYLPGEIDQWSQRARVYCGTG
jgi:hypothetical protein